MIIALSELNSAMLTQGLLDPILKPDELDYFKLYSTVLTMPYSDLSFIELPLLQMKANLYPWKQLQFTETWDMLWVLLASCPSPNFYLESDFLSSSY